MPAVKIKKSMFFDEPLPRVNSENVYYYLRFKRDIDIADILLWNPDFDKNLADYLSTKNDPIYHKDQLIDGGSRYHSLDKLKEKLKHSKILHRYRFGWHPDYIWISYSVCKIIKVTERFQRFEEEVKL